MSEGSSDPEDEKKTSGFFADGNKRTALIVAENILGLEGFCLAADDDEVVEFMIRVASYRSGPQEIEAWIRDHAEKME